MTLRDYIKHLQMVAKRDEKLLDLPVIYSSDDEGNSFDDVKFAPTMMVKSNSRYSEYEDTTDIDVADAICIN